MRNKRVHLIYGIVTGVSAVIAGICLIVACVGIYRSGPKPFTRQSIADAFSSVAIPAYIFLGLLVGNIVLSLFSPAESKKSVPEKQYEAILQRFAGKMDPQKCDPSILQVIGKQRKFREFTRWSSLILLIVCSIIFLSYGLNIHHFTKEDMNGSMIGAMKLFLPCLITPFGYAVFVMYANRLSILRETEAVKLAISQGAVLSEKKPESAPVPSPSWKKYAVWGILAVSIGLIIFGAFNNGFEDIWKKAAAICTECIGLG